MGRRDVRREEDESPPRLGKQRQSNKRKCGIFAYFPVAVFLRLLQPRPREALLCGLETRSLESFPVRDPESCGTVGIPTTVADGSGLCSFRSPPPSSRGCQKCLVLNSAWSFLVCSFGRFSPSVPRGGSENLRLATRTRGALLCAVRAFLFWKLQAYVRLLTFDRRHHTPFWCSAKTFMHTVVEILRSH